MGRAKEFFPPDLKGILESVKEEQHWTPDQAKEAQGWYERFLMLQWADPANEIVVIDKKADLLWHAHITYTLRYRVYCESCLGYFLDHIPLDRPRKPTQPELDAAEVAYGRWTKPTLAGGGGGNVSPDSVTQCTIRPIRDPHG